MEGSPEGDQERDTTILRLITGEDEAGYRTVIKDNIIYGKDNDLITDETREIIEDFRKKAPPIQPLTIKGTDVERIDSHKFLGQELTSDLDCPHHCYGEECPKAALLHQAAQDGPAGLLTIV